jgi:hypothetical protein
MYVNAKIIPVETISGIRWGVEGIKENSRGEEFKYDIFIFETL